jgi:Uma2 family endonuclease
MSAKEPRSPAEYEEAARLYMRGLPLEHFAESTGQGRQRGITLSSLSLLRARRPDVQVFNELLLQYLYGHRRQLRQVVPDNIVVVHPERIRADLSYDLPLQPVAPFWVLNYLSPYTRRKDYDDDFRRYEVELKVPYMLACYPEQQNLVLYRHSDKKSLAVGANAAGRFTIPELELETGLLDGWARFWYRGDLLLLPHELMQQIDEARQAKKEAERRRLYAERRIARLRELGVEPPQ